MAGGETSQRPDDHLLKFRQSFGFPGSLVLDEVGDRMNTITKVARRSSRMPFERGSRRIAKYSCRSRTRPVRLKSTSGSRMCGWRAN